MTANPSTKTSPVRYVKITTAVLFALVASVLAAGATAVPASAETSPVALASAEEAPEFTDVPESYQFYNDIRWMANRNITTGYPDGTFRPGNPVARDAMAAFLYRLVGSPDVDLPETPIFSDVPESHPFYKEITWLAGQEITSGFPDGTFRPSATVARDAMAAFLYRLVGADYPSPEEAPFTDVAPTRQFATEIAWMADFGISEGYSNGNGTYSFRPSIPVARDATAAFLYRLVERSVS